MAKGKNNYYYDSASVYDEAIRTLRTNIQFSDVDDNLKKIVISSAFPSEGKTTISYELGKSFAQTNSKVLLMECDLRNPRIGEVSKLSHDVGITNILLKKAELSEAVIMSEGNPNLHYLMSGPIPPNPAELLSSKAFSDLISFLEKKYDYIIFDTPPIGLVTDAAILATMVDGVILVVKSGETKKEDVKNAIESFERVNGKVIGAVLTHVKMQRSAYNSSYYHKKR